MNSTEFKYISTIERSYPVRRYGLGETLEDHPDDPSSAASSWLALIPFQLFACVEPDPSGNCKAIVEQLCDVVERFHRSPLSGIIGYEATSTPHAHLCMAAPVRLDLNWIRDYLKHQKLQSFDLQKFDHHLDGLPYTLKALNSGGEVDYRNLDFYVKRPVNRKDRKRQSRHAERLIQNKRIATSVLAAVRFDPTTRKDSDRVAVALDALIQPFELGF